MLNRNPTHRRRPLRPLLEPIEPRLLLTTTPATTTSLTLSTPVTAANQPLTLTANVTSNDPTSPTPTGTVAFFETVDFSQGPLQLYDPFHPSTYVTLSANSEPAQLLGTASLASDGTATLTLNSIPSSSALYTGQFRAAFLGSDSTFSLPSELSTLYADPGQTYGPDPNTPAQQFLLLPQGHPLSIYHARITTLTDLPADGTTNTPTDPSVPHTFIDTFGTQTFLLSPSTTPLLVYTQVARRSLDPYTLIYPPQYTYSTTVTPIPAFTHAFDANPAFQSSLSPVGTPATTEPTSLSLRTNHSTSTLTAPPTFTVSVFNPDGTQRLSRTTPAFPSNGAISHSAQAGLVVSTGGGSIGGIVGGGGVTTGGGTSTPPFVPPGPFPTGTVSFYDEHNTLLATVPLDADGNASFVPDPRSFPLGSHTLHAVYSGDATFLPASVDSAPFTITHTTTHTDIATSAPGVHAGQTFALAATVSVFDTITPTGLVSFFDENHTLLASVPLGQTSSIHLTLSAGPHTITASYAGDPDCLPSSDSTTVTILPADNSPPIYIPTGPFDRGRIDDASVSSVRYYSSPLNTTITTVPGSHLDIEVAANFTGAGNPLYPDHLFAFALSPDNIAGNADDVPLSSASNMLYAVWAAPSLSFDASGHAYYSNSFSITLPADLAPGDYHIVTTFDPDNTITETDETNNTLLANTITIQDPSAPPPTTDPAPPVILPSSPPILLPSPPVLFFPTTPPNLKGSITASHPTTSPNAPAALTLTLTNRKTKPVRRNYKVLYYLSTDRSLSPDDTRFSKQTIHASLAKKASASYTLHYKLPKSAPLGTRYLIAVADTPTHTPSARLVLASKKPLKIAAPHLSATIASTKTLGHRTRLTLRLTNPTPTPFTGPVKLRLTSPSTPLLRTLRRRLTLAPHTSTTLTVTLPTRLLPTDPTTLTVTLL